MDVELVLLQRSYLWAPFVLTLVIAAMAAALGSYWARSSALRAWRFIADPSPPGLVPVYLTIVAVAAAVSVGFGLWVSGMPTLLTDTEQLLAVIGLGVLGALLGSVVAGVAASRSAESLYARQ